MNLVLVVGAIIEAAKKIKEIYDFVQAVEEFISGPTDENRKRYQEIMAAIVAVHDLIVEEYAKILAAIAVVDERLFKLSVSNNLGLCTTALQDLEQWKNGHGETFKGLAFDASATALNNMIEYFTTKVYPGPSLVFALVEILAARMAVLADVDPTFAKSAVERKPIDNGIAFIRATAQEIENNIRSYNQVRESTRTAKRKDPDGGFTLIITVTISYTNASGSSSFSRTLGPFEDAPDADAVQQARHDAQTVLYRGVQEDIVAVHISMLRDSADRMEQALRQSELERIAQISTLHFGRIARARYTMLRRERGLKDSAQVLLSELTPPDALPNVDLARIGASILNLGGYSCRGGGAEHHAPDGGFGRSASGVDKPSRLSVGGLVIKRANSARLAGLKRRQYRRSLRVRPRSGSELEYRQARNLCNAPIGVAAVEHDGRLLLRRGASY